MPETTPQDEVIVDAKNLTATVKSAGLNTIATVATLILVCVLVYISYGHTQDARDASKVFIDAIKEQTLAMREQTVVAREQNCLISMPIDQRNVELCKRISR